LSKVEEVLKIRVDIYERLTQEFTINWKERRSKLNEAAIAEKLHNITFEKVGG